MSIFRVQHNKNYTVINNTIATDKRLSWKSKGIWMYAFSRPDDWKFNSQDIINQSTDGRDAVRAGLKELEEAGYLIREKERSEVGQYEHDEWTFFETPQELKEKVPQTGFPAPDKPVPENPTQANRPLLNTNSLPSTERKQQQAAAVSFYEILSNVDIPIADKEWLTKNFSQQEVEESVAWATHPETKITNSLAAALKWACKTKPKIPQSKKDVFEENKRLTQELEQLYASEHYTLEVYSSKAYINPKGSGQDFSLNYDESGFKDQILNALRKRGFNLL